MGFKDSYLYERWSNRVVDPPSNDFVICISASGKSSMSRTGKTTLTTFLAKKMDRSDGGFVAERNATLDAGALAYDVVPEVPNKSAVVLDEAQGAPGTDGLDARRGMKQEAIDAINSILNNGDKELTIIITAQHLPMLDKRLPPLIDAWLLIRHGPSSPDGPLAIHHAMSVEDYNFGDPQIKTPAFEEFAWPAISKRDEDYQALEQMKQDAKQQEAAAEDEDADLPDDIQARIAQQFRDLGWSLRRIAEDVDEVTYSRNWISEHTDNPDDTDMEATA